MAIAGTATTGSWQTEENSWPDQAWTTVPDQHYGDGMTELKLTNHYDSDDDAVAGLVREKKKRTCMNMHLLWLLHLLP